MSSLLEQMMQDDPDFQEKVKKLFTTPEGTRIFSQAITSKGFREVMVDVFKEMTETGTVDKEALEAKVARKYHEGNLDFDI